jgi:hypothetical protein
MQVAALLVTGTATFRPPFIIDSSVIAWCLVNDVFSAAGNSAPKTCCVTEQIKCGMMF